MAAVSERVCPPPQTRTCISISQIPHIAQAQEHAERAKEVVVQVKTELEQFHAPFELGGPGCRTLGRLAPFCLRVQTTLAIDCKFLN